MVQRRPFDCVRGFLPVALRLGPAALAILAGLLVAACGGGGTGCGGTGGSGYQVDMLPKPGLLNCSMGGSSSTGSTTPVDPNNATALDAAVAMSLNGTALTGYLGNIPATPSTSAATLAFSPATGAATGGMTASYTLNASQGGMPVYCQIQSGGLYFYNSGAVTTNPTTTLTIAYPPFTTSGTFTVTCDANDAGAYTTPTSLAVTATP